jgi:hypothetical protein
MSENAQVTLVEPTPELLNAMLSCTRETPVAELPLVPRGTKIPDGARFRTENGLRAYKVPQSDFRMAASFAQAGGVDGLKAYTKVQRANALEWANRCLADKGEDGKIYLIFPVSSGKQGAALGMYTRGLWSLKKALTAATTADFRNVFSGKPATPAKADPLSELGDGVDADVAVES